jgi:nicotinamidase-related amidase
MTNTSLARDAPFERSRTALLIVDMQRVWLEPGRDPSHPEWPPEHYFYVETSQRVIPNVQKLLAAARRNGVEVVHTIIQSLTTDGRDRSLDHKLSGLHLPPESPYGAPIPALAPIHDEIVLRKTSSGVFNSTSLNYLLRNIGIHYLVVAGIVTDQCVDIAVRDGADLGYRMTCVADACAAPSRERHLNALTAFAGYCWVADTQTVVSRFNALGTTPGGSHE